MRRSSILTVVFLVVGLASSFQLSTGMAGARGQRTFARAELYDLFGGQILDYCCKDASACLASGRSCGDKSGTDGPTCNAYSDINVVAGNRKSCSDYNPNLGYTCSQGTTYTCTTTSSCVWVQAGQVCQTGTATGTFAAPQNCSDNCPPH